MEAISNISNLMNLSEGTPPLDRCSHMNRSISHDGTYRQAVEVDQIDAAVLAEELT